MIEELGKKTFDGVKDKFKDRWDSLSSHQKDTLKSICERYAKLTAKGFTGSVDPEELAATKAALLNFEVAALIEFKSILAETIEEVLEQVAFVARKLILG